MFTFDFIEGYLEGKKRIIAKCMYKDNQTNFCHLNVIRAFLKCRRKK